MDIFRSPLKNMQAKYFILCFALGAKLERRLPVVIMSVKQKLFHSMLERLHKLPG